MIRQLAVLALAIAVPPGVVAQEAAEPQGVVAAIAGGDAGIAVRYRYEFVDQDGFPNDANASTARLRLNYGTDKWRAWSAFGEFDYVFHVLVDDFDSAAGTSPDKAGIYPIVADPDGADLNQLYLEHDGLPDWTFRFGRQRIVLDDQRFVGGVGWRQNEQTYDSLSLTTRAIPRTTLFYAYVASVRRIFGDSVPAGKSDTDTHLFNARVKLDDNWSVVPYLYYIDDEDVPAFSTATVGARLGGGMRAGQGALSLVAEAALQSDAANNPVSYDAPYFHVDVLWSLDNGVSLGLGYESLGGDSDEAGKAFRTPLATLHKFQGWADVFAVTPPQGIDDLYATLRYRVGAWDLTAVYHDFAAAAGSGDFGSELDFSAERSLGDNYGLLFKGALFSSDAPAAYADTTKLWVMLTADF